MGAFDTKPSTPPAQTEHTGQSLPGGIIDIKYHDYTIRARIAVTEADEEAILNRYLEHLLDVAKKQKRGLNQPESADVALRWLDSAWLELLILSWNLPIPLEPDRAKAMARLSQANRDFLYAQIKAAQPNQDKPLERTSLTKRPLSPDVQRAIQSRGK